MCVRRQSWRDKRNKIKERLRMLKRPPPPHLSFSLSPSLSCSSAKLFGLARHVPSPLSVKTRISSIHLSSVQSPFCLNSKSLLNMQSSSRQKKQKQQTNKHPRPLCQQTLCRCCTRQISVMVGGEKGELNRDCVRYVNRLNPLPARSGPV